MAYGSPFAMLARLPEQENCWPRFMSTYRATHVVMVGNLQGTNTFSGLLDEVRIYSRVLTLAEIQADRTTPIVP